MNHLGSITFCGGAVLFNVPAKLVSAKLIYVIFRFHTCMKMDGEGNLILVQNIQET